MDKGQLASKIRSLRKAKGYSQEQLAEEAALSLRTVQRIENGETVPHGDSLRKITRALGIIPEDLLEQSGSLVNDNSWLILLNLSALAMMFHPLYGLLPSFVIWVMQKDKVALIDESGKRLISFQIFWMLLLYTLVLIASNGRYIVWDIAFTGVLLELFRHLSVMVLCAVFLYMFNMVQIFININRSRKARASRYYPYIKFLK